MPAIPSRPEEYAEIDRVLDAEKLPELYETNISDPVKFTFRYSGQGAAAGKGSPEALCSDVEEDGRPEYPLKLCGSLLRRQQRVYYAFIAQNGGPQLQ